MDYTNNVEIYIVDFGIIRGAEIAGPHPAIILKKHKSTVTVIPITSYKDNLEKYEVLLQKGIANLHHASKAKIHQLTTVDKLKLRHSIGILPIEKVQEINKQLQEFLTFCNQ